MVVPISYSYVHSYTSIGFPPFLKVGFLHSTACCSPSTIKAEVLGLKQIKELRLGVFIPGSSKGCQMVPKGGGVNSPSLRV